jgi:hypothetical protein
VKKPVTLEKFCRSIPIHRSAVSDICVPNNNSLLGFIMSLIASRLRGERGERVERGRVKKE